MDTNSNQNQQNGQSGQKPGLSWTQPPVTQNAPKVHTQETQKTSTPSTTSAQSAQTKKGSMMPIIIGVVVIGAILIWVLAGLRHTDSDVDGMTATTTTEGSTTDNSSSTTPVVGSVSGLSIPPLQDAGLEVAVNSVSVTAPTWVVVYENRNGKPGNALGAAFFSQDIKTNAIPLLRATLSGQTYFVGESRDDGDRIFSLHNDAPVLDQSGNPVMVQFETR